MNTTPIAVSPSLAVAQPRARDAYQRLSDEIRAFPDSDLVSINIDIASACSIALGAWPNIVALRAAIVSQLPAFDIARFDKIEAYALALSHAHAAYLAVSAPPQPLAELVDCGTALRAMLFADASALVARGLLDGTRLADFRGSTGHLDLAVDLQALSALMRASWDAIRTRTGVQLAELDEAEVLSEQLLVAIGKHAQVSANVMVSAQTRQRAFTLFVKAYDDARRAVSYLRYAEDDVDGIIPSLYGGRKDGNHRKPFTYVQPVTPIPAAVAPSPARSAS